jgi:hypothetical protein
MTPTSRRTGLAPATALLQGTVAAAVFGVFTACLALRVFDVPVAAQGILVAAVALFAAVWFCPVVARSAGMQITTMTAWSVLVPLVVGILTAAFSGFPVSRFAAPGTAAVLMIGAASMIITLADRRGWQDTRTRLLLLLAVSATSCLWLGPAAELAAAEPWIATLIVNLNPVSFLATAADYDYLLATWFYQRTAFGSLRYEFWPPAIFVISCLAIILFSVIYLTVSNRRDVGRTAPDGWRKNT